MTYALYQLTIKAFIVKNGKILVLTTPHGNVDFPGGRMDDTEYDVPFKDALEREIKEELGYDISVTIHGNIFATNRDYSHLGQYNRVLSLFYEVTYNKGDISISDEHTLFEWLTPSELLLRKDTFASSDEFNVISEYIRLKQS